VLQDWVLAASGGGRGAEAPEDLKVAHPHRQGSTAKKMTQKLKFLGRVRNYT